MLFTHFFTTYKYTKRPTLFPEFDFISCMFLDMTTELMIAAEVNSAEAHCGLAR